MGEQRDRNRRARQASAAVALLIAAAVAIPSQASAQRHEKRPKCLGAAPTKVVGKSRALRASDRDEVILGGHKRERIFAGAGDDLVCARGAHDLVRGGPGADRLGGGRGRDRLVGGIGRDRIFGGRGADRIRVRDGWRDRVHAGRGADRIRARDGRPDVIDCGPGNDTVRVDNHDTLRRCEQVKLAPMPDFALPSWSDVGWIDPSNFKTVQTGDLDGDGDAELFGRSDTRVEVQDFDADLGNWVPLPSITGPDTFSNHNAYNQPQYYETIQAADLDGDGADEIFSRGSGGVAWWDYDAQNRKWTYMPYLSGPDAPSDQNSWNKPEYYTTIQAADLDSQPGEEIFGRGSGGIAAWKFDPGTQQWDYLDCACGPDGFSDQNSWNKPEYYLTIGAAELDGDPGMEIYGRGSGGIASWKFAGGTSWSYLPVGFLGGPNAPSDQQGWDQPRFYETIDAADFDGDGVDELYGRGAGGVVLWSWDAGSKAWNFRPWSGPNAPSDANGWNLVQYYSTMQAADLDGDGADELVARGGNGVNAWTLAGDAWKTLPTQGDFCDRCGWNLDYYYPSIQTARIGAAGAGQAHQLLARGLTGVVNYGYTAERNAWTGLSPGFPQFTGSEKTAYDAINQEIGGALNPSFDLRSQYPEATAGQLQQWGQLVRNMSRPNGVAPQAWNAVREQLVGTQGSDDVGELGNAFNVASWYENYLTQFTTELYTVELMDNTAQRLRYATNSEAEAELAEIEVIEGVLEGLNAFDDAEVPEMDAAVLVVNSLLGGGFTAGIGVAGVGDAVDGIDGTYLQIQSRLQNDFEAALGGNANASAAIQGDYGLQTTVGQLIQTGAWMPISGSNLAKAIAGAEQAYSLGIWQTLTPEIWVAFRFPPDKIDDWCPNGVPGPECDWLDGQGNAWMLAWNHDAGSDCDSLSDNFGPCEPAPQDLRQQLFAAPSGNCTAVNWTSACGLNQPPANVFGRQGGWGNLPVRLCNDDFEMTCPRR